MLSHTLLSLDALQRFNEVGPDFLRPPPSATSRDAADAAAREPETREAWERLAARGLIPLDWIDHPRRGFVMDARVAVTRGLATAATPTIRVPGEGRAVVLSSPPDPLVTFALGRDAAGVATAEDLAREYLARLAPFAPPGSPAPDRVLWSALPASGLAPLPPSGRPGVAGATVASELVARAIGARAYDLAQFTSLAREADRWRVHEIIARPILDATRWRAAAAEGLAVPPPSGPGAPHSVEGRSFAEVASPFEALVALWRTGYAIRRVTPDGILMVARSERSA